MLVILYNCHEVASVTNKKEERTLKQYYYPNFKTAGHDQWEIDLGKYCEHLIN